MCKFDGRLAGDLDNPHWVFEEISSASFGNC